jgi:uncharacterized membrane-anchored protein
MSRSRIALGLGLGIALQVLVVAGMVVQAALPLWTGTEVRLKTVPVDPRSMFRGNFARLRYDISRLPGEVAGDLGMPRIGEVVYVRLRPTGNGLYDLAGASLEKPTEGVFLRGRIGSKRAPYRVNYGIEAFFAPKDKALQLEQDLRGDGVAVLMVAESGRAALKDVVPGALQE